MTLAVMAVPALSLVTLPGPTSAVTDDVRTAITKLVADGATVRRIDGIDRIDTSAGAARRILRR